MVNSPAPYDTDLPSAEISDCSLQNLFDSYSESSKELTNSPSSSYGDEFERIGPDMLNLIEAAQNMRNKRSDAEQFHALEIKLSLRVPVLLN